MKNKKIIELLKCIRCNSQIMNCINDGNELICTDCQNKYPVINGVPVMLPEDAETLETKSELHKNFETSFKYIDHYQKDADAVDYFAERRSGTEHDERRVREYISAEIHNQAGTVLDVGCGKAWVAKLLCPMGYEVISMDISHRNTARAMELYPFKNHSAVVADVYSLPFEKNSFDFIIASEIIEHTYDPGKFVRILFSALKPGGKLIVTTPYKETIHYSLCVHCNKPTPLHAHLHSFDEKILKSLSPDEDLEKWKYYTFGSKILIHLRTHTILNFLNFKIWKIIDSVSNFILNVPSRIIVTWEKRA